MHLKLQVSTLDRAVEVATKVVRSHVCFHAKASSKTCAHGAVSRLPVRGPWWIRSSSQENGSCNLLPLVEDVINPDRVLIAPGEMNVSQSRNLAGLAESLRPRAIHRVCSVHTLWYSTH